MASHSETKRDKRKRKLCVALEEEGVKIEVINEAVDHILLLERRLKRRKGLTSSQTPPKNVEQMSLERQWMAKVTVFLPRATKVKNPTMISRRVPVALEQKYFHPMRSEYWLTKTGSMLVRDYARCALNKGVGSRRSAIDMLATAKHKISLLEAVDRGLKPCPRCHPSLYALHDVIEFPSLAQRAFFVACAYRLITPAVDEKAFPPMIAVFINDTFTIPQHLQIFNNDPGALFEFYHAKFAVDEIYRKNLLAQ